MAVGSNSYGTVERVASLTRDIPDGGAFSSSTTPTTTEVETWIDDVSDEVNHALRAARYTVPVANSGDDVEAFGMLTKVVCEEVAFIVNNMFPGEAMDPDDPNPLQNRKAGWHSSYLKLLMRIDEQRFAATRATSRTGNVWSGAQKDSGGDTKLPLFTRGMTDYPASRSLTE